MLQPGFVEATRGIGLALHGQGDLDAAERHLRYARGQQAHSASTNFGLAQVLAARGRLLEALGALRTALPSGSASPAAASALRELERRIVDAAIAGAAERALEGGRSPWPGLAAPMDEPSQPV